MRRSFWGAVLLVGCSGRSIDVGSNPSAEPCTALAQQEVSYIEDAQDPPEALAVGDLDGDGHPDLALANYSGSYPSLGVLLGLGDGKFRPVVTYAMKNNPPSIAIGDLNGDSKQDLVTTDSSGVVSIFLNAGSGTLAPPTTAYSGAVQGNVAIGDLNSDGHPDLVVAADEITVLLGVGDGTFQAGQPQGFEQPGVEAADSSSVAIADLDGDGDSDLVVTRMDNGLLPPLAVFLNQGDGTLTQASDPPASGFSNARSAVIADLNGDGQPDLAIGAAGQIGVALNAGNGVFSPMVAYSTDSTSNLTSVVAVDLDADGYPELIVADDGASSGHFRDDALVVLHNAGDGTFAVQSSISAALPGATNSLSNAPFAIVSADFNADGYPDIAVANQVAVAVRFLIVMFCQ